MESYIKKLITDTGTSVLASIFMIKHYPPDFTFGPHRHEQVEINFVKKGKCYMKFDREVVCFEKNDVMIIYPGVEHYFYVDSKPASLVQLEFGMDIFPELKIKPDMEEHLVFLHNIYTHSQQYMKIVHHPEITELIEKIVYEIQTEQENYKILARLMYSQLFILISRYLKNTLHYTTALPNECLNKALKILHARFNEEIDMEQLAAMCEVSGRYLRSLFQKYLHATPVDYLLSVRISKAKELMRNPAMNLKEITYQTGFSSQPYFCKRFKECTGMTPHEYRKTFFRK